jgi:Secretion system C-terminal sorting domain
MRLFLHNCFGGSFIAKALVTGVFCLMMGESWGQVSISTTTPSTQNFDAMGATTSLPTNWRIDASNSTPTWATGSTSVTQQASSGTPATGGTYNWGSTAAERSVGAMTSGSFTSPNSLMCWFQNGNTSAITQLAISYQGERYRTNTAAASVEFYYSVDGSNWTAVAGGNISAASFPTGASAYNFASPLIVSVTSFNITSLNISAGTSFYLRWNFTNTGSTNSQGIGIDDVSVTATFGTLPTNISSNSGVNWVGTNQGYAQPTNCNGASAYVMKYRRIATSTSNPTDGRGQWTTTLNAQVSGGDVTNTNMPGGAGNGFLFTSGDICGNTGTYANKWVFGGTGQGALNTVNANNWYTTGGVDMGLNMSTAGYYTFVLRDAGYANSNFYAGYTSAMPVSISHTTSSQVTLNGDYSLTVQATLSTTPSPQESFYLRYRATTNDFTAGTSLTAAGTVSGTTVTFTIPTQTVGTTLYYYIFSTTVANGTLTGYSESEKSLSALQVADNSNTNYSYTIPSSTTYTWAGAASGSWATSSNWTPAGVPANGDAVVFNNGTSVTVTAVPSVNLRSVTMTGTGAVIWQASGNRTVNIGFTGASNPVLSLAASKQFSLSGTANDIIINIESGYTATVSGTMVFSGTASVSHRLTAESASAITFQNGSLFQAQTNFSGNPFGSTGVNGSVVFQSGAIFEQYAGSNPFGNAATDNIVVFQTGSWYKYKNTSTGSTPVSSGRTFANYEYDNGISRTITGTSAIVMDNLVITSGTLNFNMTATPGHSIKGDISIASGATLNFAPLSLGTVNFNGTSEQYITINGTGSITTGANSILSIAANSTLNFVGESYIGGTGTFVVPDNATIGIGSADGITAAGNNAGNVRTSIRTFNAGATYIYNGAFSQVTGNGLPATVSNNLKIANTGSSGNNTVTLTTDNTNVLRLYLNSGLFAAGSATRNLNISNNGYVYGNGGSTTSDATAGNIVFLGIGQTNGTSPGYPNLYSVIINGSVDFNGTPANTNSATIMNRLQLNSGSFVGDAPYYQSNSTLIYNTGGSYNRNVEWGSVSDQGYPHHVTVQGGTTLNLGNNPVNPATLALAGNLSIGNNTGFGIVNMNNLSKDLEVRGNLFIGSTDVASNTSALNLSTVFDGDLWLHGNFTRYNNSFYTDNSRAIYFLGSGNSTISTPNVTSVAGAPTQYFSYLLMQKTVSTDDVELLCPVGINNQLTLTSGTIKTDNTNLLVMVDNSAVSGGSDNSYVKGPMKKIGDDAFVFPVGKDFATNTLSGASVGGHHIIGISAPGSTTDEFIAEYYLGNANLIGPITAPGLVRVSACEYWRLERAVGGSSVNVTLSWNSRSNCNKGYVTDFSYLVVAHNSANTTSGTAPFTGGDWDSYGRSTTTGNNTAGTITWNNVSTFSPFALGSTNQGANPLPFNLNRFNATLAKKSIQLDWAVGNNHEQQSYILERSKDGINFEAITKVIALKDIQVAEYGYADEQPLNGWNYYRLRATDNLSRQNTSRIIRVWWGNGTDVISVLPNPASEKIVINLSDPSSISEIQIVNVTGQVLKQLKSVQFTNEITISSLQAGMYYIRLLGKNGLITKTFVKQ